MMFDEVVIQDRPPPDLQELQLVQFRRFQGDPLEDAVVHRVHPEDGTVTLQFPSNQERLRVPAAMCNVDTLQPIEFPPMRLAPGERLPTSTEAYEHWKMRQLQTFTPPPVPSSGTEEMPGYRATGTMIFGNAPASETEAMPGYRATGTTIFGNDGLSPIPELQTNDAKVFTDEVPAPGSQPPPPPQEASAEAWSKGFQDILAGRKLDARPPGWAEACRTQFFDEPLPPPAFMKGGSTQFFGDGATAGFQASGTKIFGDEPPSMPAMSNFVPSDIMAEHLNYQHADGIKTVFEKKWGMPAPTQYALYKRGLPEEQLSTEYGPHIYSNLYRRQHDEPDEEPVAIEPENGKRIIKHTYIPLKGPALTQTPTGHWIPIDYAPTPFNDYDEGQGDFGYSESIRDVGYPLGPNDFGWLDGACREQDNRIVGFLDDWFDGLLF